jgi:hypothetical protein
MPGSGSPSGVGDGDIFIHCNFIDDPSAGIVGNDIPVNIMPDI